ncbi:MAG: hypothetical protein P8R31_08555 [Mariniblastus sp.]|nr:hypothetical protein [Mariniblastus sp.]
MRAFTIGFFMPVLSEDFSYPMTILLSRIKIEALSFLPAKPPAVLWRQRGTLLLEWNDDI